MRLCLPHTALNLKSTQPPNRGSAPPCSIVMLKSNTVSHKNMVSRLCESQGRCSFFLKETATAYPHFLYLRRSAQLNHLTKVSCSDLFYHYSYNQNMSRGSGFVRPCIPGCGNWKRRESKHQPIRARSSHQVNRCLVSLHFLCDILAILWVCSVR